MSRREPSQPPASEPPTTHREAALEPKPMLPFWRRGVVAFLVICVAGPLLGALALPLVEALASLASGRTPNLARFMGDFRTSLGLTALVGVPFAFAAGLIVALIVARTGTIGYGACAAIAFVVPCVLSLPVLGGLFVLAPFIGLVAAVIALAMRALAGWAANRFAGLSV